MTNAMTEPTELQTCPSWCTAEHSDADLDIDGSRHHPGPTIGLIEFCGTTRPDGSVNDLAGSCQTFGTGSARQTPADLRQLAADALAAAEWLEAHQ
jgi:hypothetical protein